MYRVKELNGIFTIQKKETDTETIGYFWWKREVVAEYWLTEFNDKNEMLLYSKLEEAMQQIKRLLEEPKYHYYETN